MVFKKVVAGEAVALIHGLDAAMKAREGFTAQFSKRTYHEVKFLPVVDLNLSGPMTVGTVLSGELAFTPSMSAARRIAQQTVFVSSWRSTATKRPLSSHRRPSSVPSARF